MSVLFTRRGNAPLLVDDVFSANSWEQIIEACQSNRVPETWVVGDSKMMLIDGAEYQIDIIGKNHDIYSDGTGNAPLTFQMHQCFSKKHSMHGSDVTRDSWEASRMRTTRVPEFIALMPSEVQLALRKVTKMTNAGGTSDVIIPTEDTLFLLSEIETLGTTARSEPGEGVQYEYYAKGNSAVKMTGTTKTEYWLRSPVVSSASYYCVINTSGAVRTYQPSSTSGVAFAFCF